MIADTEADKKLSPIVRGSDFQRKKTQHFTLHFTTILLTTFFQST